MMLITSCSLGWFDLREEIKEVPIRHLWFQIFNVLRVSKRLANTQLYLAEGSLRPQHIK